MNISHSRIARSLASLAVAGSLIAVSAPVLSQAKPPARQDPAAIQQRMHDRVQARLDHMAQRLQITASQQQAWNAYTALALSLAGAPAQWPAADADAATLARFHAERAAQHAKKLGQLADATATLQQALTPDQRAILAQMVRHHGGMGKHGGGHGRHREES